MPRRCGRSCWSPASSTRTTSCCSRVGGAAARSSRRRWTRRTWPPRRRRTKTSRRSRPRRSRTARRTRRATGRRRRSSGSTGAVRRTTATCTTGCTPRSTGRSSGCAVRSTRAAGRGGARADRRPRRSARRPRWAAPEVVQPLRRGDPDPVLHRPGRHGRTAAREVTTPTSHVDLVPTLLAAAGIDVAATADRLAATFTEVHPLPGRNLMPMVDGATPDDERAVYLLTRDNMLEGDSGRRPGPTAAAKTNPPAPLRIQVPAHVGSNFEGMVVRVDGRLWKLVRTFDDPATWTEPGCGISRRTGSAARRTGEPARRRVGALRPRRRPDRGRQPVVRSGSA